jgi:hypothetical protein
MFWRNIHFFKLSHSRVKVGVLRASHKIFNSEVRTCWNDASKFSSISSSQLTFCCVSSAKLKISCHDQRYSGQNARISAHYIALLIVSWFKNQYGQRWQLYQHLFPEKARIVQCYYSPFRYSCGATRQATRRLATDSPSSPIAAFLASNLLAQFFIFRAKKSFKFPIWRWKKIVGIWQYTYFRYRQSSVGCLWVILKHYLIFFKNVLYNFIYISKFLLLFSLNFFDLHNKTKWVSTTFPSYFVFIIIFIIIIYHNLHQLQQKISKNVIVTKNLFFQNINIIIPITIINFDFENSILRTQSWELDPWELDPWELDPWEIDPWELNFETLLSRNCFRDFKLLNIIVYY